MPRQKSPNNKVTEMHLNRYFITRSPAVARGS